MITHMIHSHFCLSRPLAYTNKPTRTFFPQHWHKTLHTTTHHFTQSEAQFQVFNCLTPLSFFFVLQKIDQFWGASCRRIIRSPFRSDHAAAAVEWHWRRLRRALLLLSRWVLLGHWSALCHRGLTFVGCLAKSRPLRPAAQVCRGHQGGPGTGGHAGLPRWRLPSDQHVWCSLRPLLHHSQTRLGPLFHRLAELGFEVSVCSCLVFFYLNNTHVTTWYFRTEKYVAIKVVKSAEQYKEAAEDEIKILKHVSVFTTCAVFTLSFLIKKIFV